MRLIVIALSVLALGARVAAQSGEPVQPDISKARLHFGPMSLNPTLALTNLGVDTNVFNETDQRLPKQDFTLTLTPQTDLWVRLGRSWVISNIKEDLVWYRTFASERGANHSAKLGWALPLNRLRLNVDAGYVRTRERPGFEIDARARRQELSYRGGLEVRVRPKTFVGMRAERRTIDFDGLTTFAGVNLRDALNRTVTVAALTVRQQITPFTALTVDVGREQSRFEFSPLRDSDSTNISAAVELNQFALVKGGAALGYRDFKPLSTGVPAYNGLTAAADLSYVAFGMSRVAVQVVRDVQYSFDINQPYYLLTGGALSLTQRVARPLDVVARVGRQRLNYRDRAEVTLEAPNRLDAVHTYGIGLGVHVGNDIRIGFNVDRQHRTSAMENRDYHGLTYGTSVTYGQ